MNKGNCSKHLRNKIITISLVLILPFFLTACSVNETITNTLGTLPVVGRFFNNEGGDQNKGPVERGPVTISVWGLWQREEVTNSLIESYKQEIPNVTVNYDDRSVIKPLVEYKTRVFRRTGPDSGADLSPDVMQVHISWLPQLISNDLLEPMPSSIMSVDSFSNSFYPSAVDNLVSEGKIYGMPTYYDGLVLVYNKNHFEEIGQNLPPTAWEEFRRLAADLTVRDDNGRMIRAGAAMGSANNVDFSTDILGMLFAQAGVDFPLEVDSKSAQDALSFYTNFVLEDEVWSPEFPEASVAFSQGRASMIFVPTWNLMDIVADNPGMNIGVAPVPQALPDNPIAWATYWVNVVSKSSSNPKAAWSYVSFMAQEQQQLYKYDLVSSYRVFGSPFSLISLKEELDQNPFLSPALETAPYADTNVMAARAGNRRQEEAVKEAITEVLDGSTSLEALTTAKTELSR